MPKALPKVSKQIKEKQDGKNGYVHPGSRDHRRLNWATHREDRIRKVHSEKRRIRNAKLSRVYFFQDYLKERQLPVLTEAQIKELIHSYVHRDDEERERLLKERRPGRPPSSKEDQLKMRFEKEDDEFRTGFWMPDLSDPDNVQKFVAWDGTHGSLPLVKFTRITNDQ
ncbi:translation machinery-associated protein 16 [Kalaharituber pfeilii]|nr:translation machinery-associated protein 16 [Kalaharituber pfeilii]